MGIIVTGVGYTLGIFDSMIWLFDNRSTYFIFILFKKITIETCWSLCMMNNTVEVSIFARTCFSHYTPSVPRISVERETAQVLRKCR